VLVSFHAQVEGSGTTLPDHDGVQIADASSLGLLWVFPDSQPHFTTVESQVVIGRGAESDVLLGADQVSRRHALVRRNGPLLVVEDLNSRNGTYVNGCRVTKTSLAPGSLLRIGEALAVVWNSRQGESVRFAELAPGVHGGATLNARLEELRGVAASNLSVIVEGRTGVGKEGAAHALHHFSGRAGPFVAINCAALEPLLAESQLFGHRRGAFTGAQRDEVGFVGRAAGGTLFLDEVLELPLSVQAKLLRVLQQKEYVPLGDTRATPVDLRVVSASQKPLEDAVAAGQFRDDLFARLNGYRLALPNLSERREDVPYLFRHFLTRHFGGRPPAMRARLVEALCLKEWPRNVRELETVSKRISVMYGHSSELSLDHLIDILDSVDRRAFRNSEVPAAASQPGPDAELSAALADSGGNVLRAAKRLGISRSRVYRRMLELGLDIDRFRAAPRSNRRKD
jgi:transcriptional regulator of acetoin/glycerol metabolism